MLSSNSVMADQMRLAEVFSRVFIFSRYMKKVYLHCARLVSRSRASVILMLISVFFSSDSILLKEVRNIIVFLSD